LSCALFVVWLGVISVASIQFDRNCEGYLKRAADANTVEIATLQLEKAVNYAEAHGLTTGYTSIIYQTPDEDIGFWYANLRASQKELAQVTPQTSQFEKSNLLMKLRETLVDSGQSGVSVTVPSGISLYPFNGLSATFGWASFLIAAVFGLWFLIEGNSSY
jgi:hypothetical protein